MLQTVKTDNMMNYQEHLASPWFSDSDMMASQISLHLCLVSPTLALPPSSLHPSPLYSTLHLPCPPSLSLSSSLLQSLSSASSPSLPPSHLLYLLLSVTPRSKGHCLKVSVNLTPPLPRPSSPLGPSQQNPANLWT